ncbi:SDR family oxidoreductase [Psychroflexus sediminis]|uniref:Enoyl-[acyl-carrier protein] reductase I n=1 Tax=Psychroflexus sediminis TaxID=470826 RepID=A0A1G7YYJ5_9FLAO|nr:SDR family oxidoreductase [Psychroflexus sediminis]SDH01395.1 enoyl-[acyl-carrier protein] reductase I [Psychroflexus sediminis]
MANSSLKHYALVLGGSQGLGYASALKLAQKGWHILIIHRDRRSDLPEIEAKFEVIKQCGVDLKTFNLDATNSEKRKEFVSQLPELLGESGKIKLLLHSIAKGNLKAMTGDSPLNQTDLQITVNAMAYSFYDWSKAILEAGCFATNTRLLAFTSEGNQRVWKHYAAVSVAKTSLETLMKYMATEFAEYEITANCIQAGMVETQSFQMIPGHEELKASTEKRNPFQRLTQAEDVANVVYLLSLEEANWITGSIIKADGGESL